jgi:hypothetical protein
MSLSGPGHTLWDQAITAAWNRGVLAVVSSGNKNKLASNRPPARPPKVICVGSVQSNDACREGSIGSNFGAAVDVLLPAWASCLLTVTLTLRLAP